MQHLTLMIEGQRFEVEFERGHQSGPEYTLRINGQPMRVRLPEEAPPIQSLEWLLVNDRPYRVCIDPELRWMQAFPWVYRLEFHDPLQAQQSARNGHGPIHAPIPGQVRRVLVAPGQEVQAGTPLLILEAMKMENEILAPQTGHVVRLPVQAGDKVKRGDLLIEIQ